MIGRRLGLWVLEAEVGRGAMGSVYRARDDYGRPAAVKVLSPHLVDDQLMVNRFEREIEALKQLDHPHIVKYFDSGQADGARYLAMEFVDGENYETRLTNQGRVSWVETLAVARQMASALKHAHDRGVIHRDLKPANVLSVNNSHGAAANVKITDFGVAKLFASPPLTAAGSFVGTAAYLPPEQAAGKPPSKRGDFYSLGCVMYALVTGRPPFDGIAVTELIHQHRYAQPEQPMRLVPELPNDVNDLILSMLEKDPQRRPADASLVVKQIDRIVAKLERQNKNAPASDGGEEVPDPGLAATILGSTDFPGERSGSGGVPGPATLAAGFVRQELERINRGGPVARFFNNPYVVIVLFVLCIGGIVYGIWRPQPSAEELITAARPLMQSENPADWDRAWREYLEPLNDKYFRHDYRDEVADYRRKMEDRSVRERAIAKANVGEAERFYRLGLAALQDGDTSRARRKWQAVVAAFADVPSEQRWVDMARDGLKDLDAAKPKERPAVAEALARVRKLKADGKPAEANAVLDGLESLYRDDPAAKDVIDAVRKLRES